MQFRAGIFYVLLFAVVAAGAYGVIATAEAPDVTIDEGDADYQLEAGQEFDVGDRTFNVSDLSDGSGTAEYVNESAILEVTWGAANTSADDDWNDGDTVQFEAEGTEYYVYLQAPAEGENASEPSSFSLVENFDGDEYEPIVRDGDLYALSESGNGSIEYVAVDDHEEIDVRTYEAGDTVEFYESDREAVVSGEITEVGETVTVQYEGTSEETYDLAGGETVTLNGTEFAVYYPSGDEVYLSSDVESFQSQQADVDDFHQRIAGLWWVLGLSVLTAVALAALAFMPVRG